MEGNNEVCSVDQSSGKPYAHELQGIANQGEAAVRKLPSVATAENLVSPNSISEKQINNGKSNIKASAQATAGLRSFSSLTLHEYINEFGLVWCSLKPNCSSKVFGFYFNLVNFHNFGNF